MYNYRKYFLLLHCATIDIGIKKNTKKKLAYNFANK